MSKIKVCGITNVFDAQKALKLSADYLGFNNIKGTKRFVDLVDIMDIVSRVPESLRDKCVLLAKEQDIMAIIKLAKSIGVSAIQPYLPHESNNDAYYKKARDFGLKVFRVIHIENKRSLMNLKIDPDSADYFILDTKPSDPNLMGGTGEAFDWYLYNCAKEILPERKMCLAGGLNIKNIEDALDETETNLIDICTGLEDMPGLKNHDKMDLFFEKVNNFKTGAAIKKPGYQFSLPDHNLNQ